MVDAKDSVDRLHVLVERCYKEMSSRIQALEVLNEQHRSDADRILGDNAESVRTIHAHQPDLSPEVFFEGELVPFDFSNELHGSRVYRRNQAFRGSVISALTNSVYSLAWSFFSEMSMAEISNISVINLAITERETHNPHRSCQTWSAQPKHGPFTGPYTYEHRDGQRTHSLEVIREPIPVNTAGTYQESSPAVTQIQQQGLPGVRPLTPLLAPVPQVMIDSTSGFPVALVEQVEAEWQCNGCGEVRNSPLVLAGVLTIIKCTQIVEEEDVSKFGIRLQRQ